jgi:hypothetical protein
MSNQPDLEALNKRCERSITKMTENEALKHIALLIDDSHDATFEPGGKRALYLIEEIAKRPLAVQDAALLEYFRANA